MNWVSLIATFAGALIGSFLGTYAIGYLVKRPRVRVVNNVAIIREVQHEQVEQPEPAE